MTREKVVLHPMACNEQNAACAGQLWRFRIFKTDIERNTTERSSSMTFLGNEMTEVPFILSLK